MQINVQLWVNANQNTVKNSVNYVNDLYKIFLKVFDAKWIPNFKIPQTTLPPALDTNLEST